MARTLPNVPVHAYAKFTWAGPNGSAEVSDFNPATLAGRLYGDAVDVGFFVQGNRRKMLFSEASVDRDAEGEVTAWNYESPEGFKIKIFND
jgi:hypothetical protein